MNYEETETLYPIKITFSSENNQTSTVGLFSMYLIEIITYRMYKRIIPLKC